MSADRPVPLLKKDPMALPTRRRRWFWLLAVPTVAPLLTPLYNRITPTLWGVPFFYWYQLACAGLALIIIAAAHLSTRANGTSR